MASKAITERRSIRRFADRPIAREDIEKILDAGMLAPSAKNRQPWRFVVVTEEEKAAMLRAMELGILSEAESREILPGSSQYSGGAMQSLRVMEQAPAVVFVINPLGSSPLINIGGEERLYEIANTLSIGAAIENMSLIAVELGLGSLWICDVFFAYRELCDWLGTEDQLVSAIAIGYPDECPPARPRKKRSDIVEWR